jgi:hypothetical protein
MAKLNPRQTATKVPQCPVCGFYLPVTRPDGKLREIDRCPQCGSQPESLYETPGRELLIGLAPFAAIIGLFVWLRP